MANVLFDPGREGILDDTISMSVGVMKMIAVRGYTFSAAHKFVSDVTGAGGTIASTSAALASKTYTNGVFDAADQAPAFAAVGASGVNHVIIIIQASAVTGGADVAATAQRVIAYLDTGTLLPFTTNGGDINVTFDNGANKIFKL
jgi:hypothetical protein